MKRLMLGLVLLMFCVGACGSPKPEAREETPSPTVPTTTASASPTALEPPKLESLIIAPGGVGPLGIGMSIDEALATKVAVKRTQNPDDGCELPELAWIDSYQDALDVWIDDNGDIISIGVYQAGPHTVEGLGVGSTLGEISRTYENAEMGPVGTDQTGLFVSDGNHWLGFLFDGKPEKVNRDSVVQFVEVTGDSKPSLMRIGC